jgi:hypothetical protein
VVGVGAPAALSHTTGETKNLSSTEVLLRKEKFLFPLNNSNRYLLSFDTIFTVITDPLLIEFTGDVKKKAFNGNCANAPSNSHP